MFRPSTSICIESANIMDVAKLLAWVLPQRPETPLTSSFAVIRAPLSHHSTCSTYLPASSKRTLACLPLRFCKLLHCPFTSDRPVCCSTGYHKKLTITPFSKAMSIWQWRSDRPTSHPATFFDSASEEHKKSKNVATRTQVFFNIRSPLPQILFPLLLLAIDHNKNPLGPIWSARFLTVNEAGVEFGDKTTGSSDIPRNRSVPRPVQTSPHQRCCPPQPRQQNLRAGPILTGDNTAI